MAKKSMKAFGDVKAYARATVQRIANAETSFVESIMAKGMTKDEATKAMRTLLRLKMAKIDSFMGRINVTHGAYLEIDVLRRAAQLGAA